MEHTSSTSIVTTGQSEEMAFSLVNCTITNLECNNTPNLAPKKKISKKETDATLAKIYIAFKKFYATPRNSNARGVAHNIIADHHPNHHLIGVSANEFDFLEFAAAGYAKAELELEDNCFDVGRKYSSPLGGRTYGKAAKVNEKMYWGRYKYTWQNNEFMLYAVSWKMEYDHDVHFNFLLHPRSAGEAASPKTELIDQLLLKIGEYASMPHEDVFVFSDDHTFRSKSMYEAIKNAKWEDVILDPSMKEAMMKDVISFFQPATKDLYSKYNIPYKRGIILHGSPGNGKTITIKALINHLQHQAEPIPTLYVKSMKNKCKGDQESLKKLFKDARRRAPVLLIFEDLDSLISGEVRSHFLNEVDGLESNDGILMLGSTNHLDNIDEAIRSRPSRFDRKYAFELPDRVGRERYAQYWRGKLADNRDLEFPEEICGLAADLTVGFSFAYLKELFISTLLIVSQGVRGEDLEWDVIEDKSASTSDSGEDISKVDAVEATSVASESTDETTKIVDGEKKGEENLKKRRDMPKIVVPEQLKKNVFLAVLQQQCKFLINGMVNSDAKEEEKKEKKKAKENEEKDKKKDDDHSCAKC